MEDGMSNPQLITLEQAPSLAALFRERVARRPEATAYIQFDPADGKWHEYSWRQTADEVSRWQQALRASGLKAGDRVVIMCHNAWEWVICDQATLGLGLVLVPVFMNDRADNIAWITNDCQASTLVIEGPDQWRTLEPVVEQLESIHSIIALKPVDANHEKLHQLADWLPEKGDGLAREESAPDELATIVYTSGTTGRPKGVMLSHHNILWNVHAALKFFDIGADNTFLSFLPLSHTFERTVGYYLAMACGCATAYNRSIPQLAEDLSIIKPSLMISVPRIFERIYGRIMDKLADESALKKKLFRSAIDIGWRKFEHDQGRGKWSPRLLLHPLLDALVGAKVRERLGGRLHFTVCGGAALSPDVARLFIGLGIPVVQGYGLTETSPVIAANPLENNLPASVGLALPGVEVRTSDQGELLTRSPSVMLGYWENEEATREAIDADGWLHSGDQARVDEGGHWYITGRIKEIIVLSNGEKVPPADMEMAIAMDPLFEQVMIIGEGRPFLSALAVLNPEQWQALAAELGVAADDPAVLGERAVEKALLARLGEQIRDFPGYAQVRRLIATLDPWTIEDGLLTPTMKMKRARILERFGDRIEALYREGRR